MRPFSLRDWLRTPCLVALSGLGLAASSLFATAFAEPPPPLDLTRVSGHVHLTGHAEFLADPDGRHTFDELRAQARGPGAESAFSPLTPAALSPGMTQAPYWLRVRLTNGGDDPIPWVLLAEAAYLDHVDAWLGDGDGNWRALELSDRRPFGERALSYRALGLEHTTPAAGYSDLYLRVNYDRLDTMHLGFRLIRADSVTAFIAREYFGYGLLYGALLILAAYALIVWRQARDRRFGLYAAYIFSTLLTWMAVNGHLHQFVLPDWPELVNQGMHVIFLLMVITALLFTRSFLETARILPRADRVLMAAIAVLSLAIAMRLAGLWTVPLLISHGAVALLVLLTLLGAAAWRRGITYARWFVAAWLVYGGMLLLNALHVSGALSWLHTGEIYPLAQSLNLLEVVMLAMAQSDRMRLLQRDQQQAEQRYRELLESHNDVLERMVGERTQELTTAWARAREESETDEATGLSNRRYLLRAGESALADPSPDRLEALAYFDLDDFKIVNDAQGHAAGDAVLRTFARTLEAAVREGDITARFGGDEFVVLLTNLSSIEEARRIVERICERFRATATVHEGMAIAHTASAGIAVRTPDSRTRLSILLAQADVALYRAKHLGRDCVVIGDGGREPLDEAVAPA